MTRKSPGERETAFIARFGGLFEHSPWVARQAFAGGKTDTKDIDALEQAFCRVIMRADREKQLALLNAHPELACAEADRLELTDDSKQEQSGAGLDQCTPGEFREFGKLNRAYHERFGFPFIVAVKGLRREEILAQFRSRIGNEPAQEFDEALRQVCRIGRLRLEERLHDQS